MSKKILILEDEKELARLYGKLLKDQGYEVTLVFDGLEGLEKLHKVEPDLILMDVSMPNMSGVGFYHNVCNSVGRPMYPILVVTGRLDLEKTFRSLPIDGIILKPFKRELLLKEVQDILSRNTLLPIS